MFVRARAPGSAIREPADVAGAVATEVPGGAA